MERRQLVVVGNGMVGHRFVESAVDRQLTDGWDILVIGDERWPAYDRVALTSYLAGASADDLILGSGEGYGDSRVRARHGDEVVAIDRAASVVRCRSGETHGYDALVLATGISAVRPADPWPRLARLLRLPHHRRPRCHRARAPPTPRPGHCHRWRPPGPRGRQRPALASASEHPRRRVRAAADACAGGRRRRRASCAGDRGRLVRPACTRGRGR